MKILTSNYITCAVKACKSSTLSFPLHFQDAELVQEEIDFSAEFIVNILPRIEWDALVVTAAEVCRPTFVCGAVLRKRKMKSQRGAQEYELTPNEQYS